MIFNENIPTHNISEGFIKKLEERNVTNIKARTWIENSIFLLEWPPLTWSLVLCITKYTIFPLISYLQSGAPPSYDNRDNCLKRQTLWWYQWDVDTSWSPHTVYFISASVPPTSCQSSSASTSVSSRYSQEKKWLGFWCHRNRTGSLLELNERTIKCKFP